MRNNRSLFYYILFLIILNFFFFTGCNTPDKCGVIDGAFRHKYWHYYKRGISYANCKQFQKAESDFRQAIKLENDDKRRKRTYGGHFIDYYPNRELGIVLFFQKKYSAAIDALKQSLETVKNAKAEFYLDKSRSIFIDQNKLDHHPPKIKIKTPNDNTVTNKFKISVSGQASDDTFVKVININGIPVRIDLSEKVINFKTYIHLTYGENILEIEVYDISGNQTKIIKTISCDTTGPILTITDYKNIDPKNHIYEISGYAYDSFGLKTININDQIIPYQRISECVFKQRVQVLKNQQKIYVIAQDAAGNNTHAEIFIADNAKIPLLSRPLYASNDLIYTSKILSKMFKEYYYNNPINTVYYCSNSRGGASHRENININVLGDYHALIIGINDYQKWNVLKTAVNDAITLKKVLIQKYAFEDQNVSILINSQATRPNIINKLRLKAQDLNHNDNLLIYFAGHGSLDNFSDEGYWIPVEGEHKDPTSWVTHNAIQTIITAKKLLGKNIIVITDSCYGGKLFRSGGVLTVSEKSNKYEDTLLKLASKRSRQIISSGGIETVSDEGRDGHSIFAYYFLEALRSNTKNIIDLEKLFLTQVWDNVSQKGGQRPQFGRFKTAMDENGQFVLALKSYLKNSNQRPIIERSQSIREHKTTILDTQVPSINIKHWKNENKSVFIDKAFLEGSAYDESGIQKITINGRNFLNKPGQNVYFNCLVNLSKGLNSFTLECEDQVGNKTSKIININRKLQDIDQIGSRMSLEINQIESFGINCPEIEDYLLRELQKSKRFQIKELIKNSQNKSNVEFFLKGKTIVKKDSINIAIRIIEKINANILTISEVYGEGKINNAFIDNLCQGLTIKILDELPIVKGQVAKVLNEKVIINRGRKHGLKQGMHLIFYNKGEPIIDPETGEILDENLNIEIGSARVVEIKSKIAYTIPIKEDIFSKIKVGLYIVIK